jgi:hypothetical protein
MPFRSSNVLPLFAVLLPLSLASAAWAQAPAAAPTKPAAAKPAAAKPGVAKPPSLVMAPAKGAPAKAAAADNKTLALGGGKGDGAVGARKPILTRDELRVCLNQEGEIRTRIEKHEALRPAIADEKTAILASQEELKNELAALQPRHKEAVDSLNAKNIAHGKRVETFNESAKTFAASGRSGPSQEKARKDLNDEQVAINAAAKTLDGERTATIERMQSETKAFNEKKALFDARIAGWNARNKDWNDTNARLEDERKGWIENCSDRRYREEDETAIKSGK